jgi:hypothetical protein
MCDECDESSGLYLAYFNKPGGNRWRPDQKAAAVSPALDRFAINPVAVAAREVRFACDQGTRLGASEPSRKRLRSKAAKHKSVNAIISKR